MSVLRRWIGLIGVSLLIGVCVPQATHAHESLLIKSSPNPDETLQNSPNEIVLQFSEELDTKASYLELVDISGVTIAKGTVDLNDVDHATLRAAVPAVLGKGVYTVRYSVLLLDGDTTEKQFDFGVGVAVGQAQGLVGAPAKQAVSNQQPVTGVSAVWVVPGLTVLVVLVLGVVMLRRRMIKA